MKDKVDAIETKLASNEGSGYFKQLNAFLGTEVPEQYLDSIVKSFD